MMEFNNEYETFFEDTAGLISTEKIALTDTEMESGRMTTIPIFSLGGILSAKECSCSLLQTSPLEIKEKEEEIIREVPIGELMKIFELDWTVIEKEVEELLNNYGITTPKHYVDRVISWVKESIEKEIGDLPYKEYILELLTKLYIHIAYTLLMV